MDTPDAAPACWCAYGTEGGEFTRFPYPGCPAHDPDNTPPATADDDEPCWTCANEWEDCHSCEGGGDDDYAPDGRCYDCGGSGGRVPTHCCRCGGGEYNCLCCSTCDGDASVCLCKIPVQMSDGSTRTV